ncbi:hypothetical protein BC936DRAFT_142915 [Jimgerdemannia flammicorona]|uniref:SAM domain-containing protein n=1 Tax=Jimgerdemannia flammicorona TaxID=994334 RepID=A0A433DEL1_9FUNG|nr:hypothetical protein BC936DRAFT_142915 [Jimgerdemannia flammicorona]
MTAQARPLSESFTLLSNSKPSPSNSSSTAGGSGFRPLSTSDMSAYDAAPSPSSSFKTHHQHRGPRPVSEILQPGNYTSPEAEAIDKWFEDLQHYEQTLEEMATASLDQNFKDELTHVDQWFKFLSEAERTAALFSLLQHSTQVQIRFLITVLQQMAKKDPMGALLSPANPEKGDAMQSQLAGAMAKAELEASAKLLSVLPYQTGQVNSRPSTTRRLYDRHSLALGETEEYTRLYGNRVTNDFLSPRTATFSGGNVLDARIKARVNTPSPFNSRPSANVGNIGDRTSIGSSIGERTSNGRPKSADVTNWSLGGMPPILPTKDGKDELRSIGTASPWGLSPTVATFNERGSAIERPNSASEADLANAIANWSIGGGNPGSRIVLDDVKSLRRAGRGVATPGKQTNVPITVPESDREGPHSNTTNIVLSMYDDGTTGPVYDLNGRSRNSPILSPLPLPSPKPLSRPSSRPTSPLPHTPTSGLFPGHPAWSDKSKLLTPPGQHYGQYLNPYDGADAESEYLSDHSDASNLSHGSGLGHRRPSSSRAAKDKKAAEVVDLQLLTDIPAWLRSLRLHKYNDVFVQLRWQDIVKMSDEDLTAKGVAALGARRKMLKVFENVRAHCAQNNIPY